MKMNLKYIFAFWVLLILEIIIGLFVNDPIIRPYVGDVIVIILMYTCIRGFMQKYVKFLPIYLLIFASTVELAQYFGIVNYMHLQDNKAISILIGTTFDIKDVLCYLIGTIIIISWEKIEK